MTAQPCGDLCHSERSEGSASVRNRRRAADSSLRLRMTGWQPCLCRGRKPRSYMFSGYGERGTQAGRIACGAGPAPRGERSRPRIRHEYTNSVRGRRPAPTPPPIRGPSFVVGSGPRRAGGCWLPAYLHFTLNIYPQSSVVTRRPLRLRGELRRRNSAPSAVPSVAVPLGGEERTIGRRSTGARGRQCRHMKTETA